jgi:hypothetical protein
MGDGAFILLKVGCAGPKSAKQAEIRLAGLLKILQTAVSGRAKPLAREWTGAPGAYSRRFLLDMANLSRIAHFVI